MDDSGTLKEDLSLPTDEELVNKIHTDFKTDKILMINVQSALGREQVMSYKEAK